MPNFRTLFKHIKTHIRAKIETNSRNIKKVINKWKLNHFEFLIGNNFFVSTLIWTNKNSLWTYYWNLKLIPKNQVYIIFRPIC